MPYNVVFTAHDYALPGIAGDATGYPGVVRGEFFDRGVVEQTFLVRHILLVEPLAERYARLFQGMSPERARELAASFRLENCVVREDLARLPATR